MGPSRHDGASDVLTSANDLRVALGVRLRERPGARWMVEMHPETLAGFDVEDFHLCFGTQDVRLRESRSVMPGEFHLLQRGFGTSGEAAEPSPGQLSARAPTAPPQTAAPSIDRGYAAWRRRLIRRLARPLDMRRDPLTCVQDIEDITEDTTAP
jgi:hypothetical protein